MIALVICSAQSHEVLEHAYNSCLAPGSFIETKLVEQKKVILEKVEQI